MGGARPSLPELICLEICTDDPVASGDPHGDHASPVTIFLTVYHLLRYTGVSLYLSGGPGLAVR